MATTTTNFGWDIPQSTDLVKDGATAIAALGQDIDTALVDLKGGTTNQVLRKASGTDLDFSWATPAAGALTLITSSPFTTVSSHSINSCFTSTYVNYFIIINFSATSGDTVNLSMKLRASGSDTSANYASQRLYAVGASVGADADPLGTDEYYITNIDKDFPAIGFPQITIGNPQTATKTTILSQSLYRDTSIGINQIGGFQNSDTQFDGFTLIASTGTMSGTARVYGYQNS